jgi:hypothetical protein
MYVRTSQMKTQRREFPEASINWGTAKRIAKISFVNCLSIISTIRISRDELVALTELLPPKTKHIMHLF